MVVGGRPIEKGCGYYDDLWILSRVGKLEQRMPRSLEIDRNTSL